VAGPLRGVELEMLPLTVTTWGSWKDAHPTTTILAEDPGTGRTYEADPLAGRDADGPIFPVGERDDRLPARIDPAGPGLPSHEAFWFAWSQFHPGTLLWEPGGRQTNAPYTRRRRCRTRHGP
jgi:hypothetical protein